MIQLGLVYFMTKKTKIKTKFKRGQTGWIFERFNSGWANLIKVEIDNVNIYIEHEIGAVYLVIENWFYIDAELTWRPESEIFKTKKECKEASLCKYFSTNYYNESSGSIKP